MVDPRVTLCPRSACRPAPRRVAPMVMGGTAPDAGYLQRPCRLCIAARRAGAGRHHLACHIGRCACGRSRAGRPCQRLRLPGLRRRAAALPAPRCVSGLFVGGPLRFPAKPGHRGGGHDVMEDTFTRRHLQRRDGRTERLPGGVAPRRGPGSVLGRQLPGARRPADADAPRPFGRNCGDHGSTGAPYGAAPQTDRVRGDRRLLMLAAPLPPQQ